MFLPLTRAFDFTDETTAKQGGKRERGTRLSAMSTDPSFLDGCDRLTRASKEFRWADIGSSRFFDLAGAISPIRGDIGETWFLNMLGAGLFGKNRRRIRSKISGMFIDFKRVFVMKPDSRLNTQR